MGVRERKRERERERERERGRDGVWERVSACMRLSVSMYVCLSVG